MKKCLCWLLCTVLLCSVGVSLAACAENPGSSSTLAAASATSEAGSASGVASSGPAASASLEPIPVTPKTPKLPALISSPVAALQRPQSYPAPAFSGAGSWQYPYYISPHEEEAGDRVLASVDPKKSLVRVSTDGGENWEEYELPKIENLSPKMWDVVFSSKTEGILVYGESLPYAQNYNGNQNKPHAFIVATFSTKDGGQTWQHRGTTAFPHEHGEGIDYENSPQTSVHGIQHLRLELADATTGWIYFNALMPNNATLYETFDGGARWSPIRIQYTEHMQPGTQNLPVSPPHYEDGKWVCTVGDYWDYGRKPFSVPAGQYTFTPAKDGQSWVWDDPGWDLPAGINPIEFMDNTQVALAPVLHAPGETDESDWHVQSDFQQVSETLRYIGREVEVLHQGSGFRHPVEDVAEMMEVLYDYKDFDISLLGQYEEGKDYVDYLSPDRGMAYMNFEVLQVSTRANGIIEAVWEYRIETTDGGDDPDAETSFLRRLYRPVTVDGVQLFTLLSSEEIEKPA